ncbi:hypothetical protein SAMN02745133_01606 [Desulforamulus putei DSM 12395]|uniref:Uncharacterized protein n=1 Tax=Desulforamulus putei DSM 12395 TaxID=1121429 RepID=A0A1M4Y1G9_9FIRM|nr:hypothetical protein SAMN02745133_01606 [Desulforamulus putei DSM 12395]
MIKICPKCKNIAHFNSYFKAYMCLDPQCSWMEEVIPKRIEKSLHERKIAVKRTHQFACAK